MDYQSLLYLLNILRTLLNSGNNAVCNLNKEGLTEDCAIYSQLATNIEQLFMPNIGQSKQK